MPKKVKVITIHTVNELINIMSEENDRIGDFEPIRWLITKEDFVLQLYSGKIVKLINKPVETTKEQPDYKKAYEILSEYFDSISDEEQPKVTKRLAKIGL